MFSDQALSLEAEDAAQRLNHLDVAHQDLLLSAERALLDLNAFNLSNEFNVVDPARVERTLSGVYICQKKQGFFFCLTCNLEGRECFYRESFEKSVYFRYAYSIPFIQTKLIRQR